MIASDVNVVAILVAAVAQMIVGFAWYSKTLFGTQWAAEMGFKMDDPKMKEGMGKMMAINFIMAIIMAYVLSKVAAAFGAATFGGGAGVGFWIWLGFILPLLVGAVLWERRSGKLLRLNASYWLVVLLIMGGIVAAF